MRRLNLPDGFRAMCGRAIGGLRAAGNRDVNARRALPSLLAALLPVLLLWFWLPKAPPPVAPLAYKATPQPTPRWEGKPCGPPTQRDSHMATYPVTGAGDSAYNGSYVETGTYSGAPEYILDTNHRLYWDSSSGAWAFGDSTHPTGSGVAYVDTSGLTIGDGPEGSSYTPGGLVGYSGPAPTVGSPVTVTQLSTPTLVATRNSAGSRTDLSWTKIANVDSPTAYTYERNINGAGWGDATGFSDPGPDPVTDYDPWNPDLDEGDSVQYRVKAEGSGAYSDSAWSNIETVVVHYPPLQPEAPTISAVTPTLATATDVTLSPLYTTSMRFERRISGVGSYATIATISPGGHVEMTGLTPNQHYDVRFVGINSYAETNGVEGDFWTDVITPNPPHLLASGPSSVLLHYGMGASNSTLWRLQRRRLEDTVPTWINIASTTTAEDFADSVALFGTYEYRVKAEGSAGNPNTHYSSVLTHGFVGVVTDTIPAPPPPSFVAVSSTAENVLGIVFDALWDTVELELWRLGYESDVSVFPVVESTVLNLTGLLSGQPYVARFRAIGVDPADFVYGPTAGFTPGDSGDTSPSAPAAPGEITETRLTDVSARLKMPALPAGADSLRLLQDGVVIRTDLSGASVVTVLGLSELTTYTFRAQSVNVFGQTLGPELLLTTESTAEQGTGGAPDEDAADPVCAWVSPGDSDTVAGQVDLIADASDDVAVVEVRFYANNVLLDTLSAPNWPLVTPTQYKTVWDARGVPNGLKTLRVEADDALGNTGSDSIMVTLGNSINNLTGYWVSPSHVIAAQSAQWKTSGQYVQEILCRTQIDTVAEDDAFNFNWEALALPGGVLPAAPLSTDEMEAALANAVPLQNGVYVPILGDKEEALRVIVRRAPRVVWSSYEHGAAEAVRFFPYTQNEVAKVGILTLAPNKIFSLSGEVLSLAVDLSALTDYVPLDFVFFEDLWYVAMGLSESAGAGAYPHIRVIDPQSGRLAYKIEIPDDTYATTALAVTASNAQLWLGATSENGLGGDGKIYIWDGKSPAPVTLSIAGITRLVDGGISGGVLAGTNDGKVYAVTANGGTLLETTGEDAVLSLLRDNALAFAGTKANGKLFSNRGGSWSLEQDFVNFDEVRALALHSGELYAAGDSNELWKRSSSWAQVAGISDLPNVTAINDMVSYNGKLLLATTTSDGLLVAREKAAAPRPGTIIAQLLDQISFEARWAKVPA